MQNKFKNGDSFKTRYGGRLVPARAFVSPLDPTAWCNCGGCCGGAWEPRRGLTVNRLPGNVVRLLESEMYHRVILSGRRDRQSAYRGGLAQDYAGERGVTLQSEPWAMVEAESIVSITSSTTTVPIGSRRPPDFCLALHFFPLIIVLLGVMKWSLLRA